MWLSDGENRLSIGSLVQKINKTLKSVTVGRVAQLEKIITSEREARSEFLLIYTKNLSMSGRPAGRPWSRF